MSGHSKWATIHRQKEVKDAARGKLFSKLARSVTIAVKTGGGPDPDANFKLRIAVEKARASNMPKANIERAIASGAGGNAIEEITYEGFGPGGVSVMVQAATDNRNRTGQEIKNIFEKLGGSLAGPGAVSFNFDSKGVLLVSKGENPEEQTLKLIDLGVEDIEESDDAIEVYTSPTELWEVKNKISEAGFNVISSELTQKPKTLQAISDANVAKKVVGLLETLEEYDDVNRVFANVDIPENVVAQL